jgi:hypothetical protein
VSKEQSFSHGERQIALGLPEPIAELSNYFFDLLVAMWMPAADTTAMPQSMLMINPPFISLLCG